MTTTQAPNPREFKSWEDAFQYPVPVVRRLEQQLRSNINENRDKLRSLVGSSYRDLLGTAERIVEMDTQMQSVETRLGDIGQKCNARAIERIATNHQANAKAQRDRSLGRNALASTVALLQSCMNQATRIIGRRDDALRAAKLLVLARLLYTSAAKSPKPPAILDNLKSKLASLRRRLLNHIDKRLSSVGLEKTVLVETLAAFSLASTSTPADVLNHFLHVRGIALRDLVESPIQADLHDAMSLLIGTLKEVQAVFPRQLSNSLERLQSEPLLKDEGIRGMPELNLDVYERWIAEDVRNFTPWLRHDQLQASAATAVSKKWVAEAKSTFVAGLQSLLGPVQDTSVVLSLRKDLLSRSLSADRKLPGLDPSDFFEKLRSCFNDRLRHIAEESTAHVAVIVSDFLKDQSVTDQTSSDQSVSLWDPENMDVDSGKGAIIFRNLIQNASQGKGARLQALEKSLQEWASKVAALSSTVKAMREDRWNDDLDLDIEDNFDVDSPQDLLAKEDPDELQKLLASEKDKTLSAVYANVQSAATSDMDENRVIVLLRLLREVAHQALSIESQGSTSKPPLSLFEKLHEVLASKIVERLLQQSKGTRGAPRLFVRSPITALWEGTPPLPVQPSTTCFKYLHETCKTMKDIGSDLWTPSAVSILKKRLRKTVVDSLENLSAGNKQTNGIAKATEEASKRETDTPSGADAEAAATTNGSEDKAAENPQDTKIIQAVFDLLYFDKMLSISRASDAADTFDAPIKDLKTSVELDDAAMERLRKSSVDYYKRTYLLFGLLAVGQ